MKTCTKCGSTDAYADGRCKPCTRIKNTAWAAAKRASDPAAARARDLAKYAANPEAARAKNAAWRLRNPGAGKDVAAAHREKNKEKISARYSAYAAGNKEKIKARMDIWHSENPDARKIHEQNRRARMREVGGELSIGLPAKLFKLQRGKCACCKADLSKVKYHMDHRVAIFNGGKNEDSNMELLCAPCNCSKGKKHPVDFMQSRGFLI